MGAVLEGVADRVEVTRRVAAAALLQQGAGPARQQATSTLSPSPGAIPTVFYSMINDRVHQLIESAGSRCCRLQNRHLAVHRRSKRQHRLELLNR